MIWFDRNWRLRSWLWIEVAFKIALWLCWQIHSLICWTPTLILIIWWIPPNAITLLSRVYFWYSFNLCIFLVIKAFPTKNIYFSLDGVINNLTWHTPGLRWLLSVALPQCLNYFWLHWHTACWRYAAGLLFNIWSRGSKYSHVFCKILVSEMKIRRRIADFVQTFALELGIEFYRFLYLRMIFGYVLC